MKVTKRDNVKYPIKVTLSSGRSIIVPRQSKFKTKWLHDHGCPFVSQYEALQFLGIRDKKPMDLWKYAKAHLKRYIGATMWFKGVVAEMNHYAKGKATCKYFSPKDITAARITKYLKAGCIIIITRRKPVIHYYCIVMDKGQIYILNAGKCAKISAKQVVSVKCNNKNYGGMLVVTPKKAQTKKNAPKKSTAKKTSATKKTTVTSKKTTAKKTTAKKSNKEIAKEVVNGKWGNGEERRKKLKAAGYDYSAVQKLVNEMVK